MLSGVASDTCNITKKRLRHRRIPVNIEKFLRTAFFTENLYWLLLDIPTIIKNPEFESKRRSVMDLF